jgi:integrase
MTRSHVLAWRVQLEKRGLAEATIRRKLAALASLFERLLECNAVAGGKPVHGVKRPRLKRTKARRRPGRSPGQGAARCAGRDDAEGAARSGYFGLLLYHGFRREEAAQLGVSDILERRGIKHLLIHGKGGKVRYLPLHPVAADRIHAYLEHSGHHLVPPKGPLFLPLRGLTDRGGITADGIYKLVEAYAKQVGIKVEGLGVHGLRATATTNALEHEADIAKVQAWLGHANISTTRIYDAAGK